MEEEMLALFLLNTVLFPGMPLPLHIFEERYKLMIGRCVEQQRPFGVVLIRSGLEVGGPAVPYPVGTMAAIANVKRLDDGRMNLIAVGQDRFRIVEVVRQEPYMVARVTSLVDAEPEDWVAPLAEDVRSTLVRYLRDLFTLLDQPHEALQLPREPARLSLVTAAVMQIPMAERQALLGMTDVAQRLVQEKEWLDREIEKQKTLLRVKKQIGPVTPMDTSQHMGRMSPN
jgi:Lon protease-like protein